MPDRIIPIHLEVKRKKCYQRHNSTFNYGDTTKSKNLRIPKTHLNKTCYIRMEKFTFYFISFDKWFTWLLWEYNIHHTIILIIHINMYIQHILMPKDFNKQQYQHTQKMRWYVRRLYGSWFQIVFQYFCVSFPFSVSLRRQSCFLLLLLFYNNWMRMIPKLNTAEKEEVEDEKKKIQNSIECDK